MGAQTPAGSIIFREIASAIGRDDARLLVQKLGGSRIYVPQKPADDHELVKAIGAEAAQRLAYYFHGTHISLPTLSGPLKRRLVRELGSTSSLTRAAIARETGYCERTVYRILGKGDDAQGDLFTLPDESC